MRTFEIARSSWESMLAELSEEAAGRSVRLEVENAMMGDQELENLRPLHQISLETKGSAAGMIDIAVGGRTTEIEHRIENPVRLFVLLRPGGEIDCLSIEDAAGGKSLLIFEDLTALPAEARAAQETPALH